MFRAKKLRAPGGNLEAALMIPLRGKTQCGKEVVTNAEDILALAPGPPSVNR